MSGDTDSAFVEIAARAPEVDLAGERLVPLYEDIHPDPDPEPPRKGWLRRASRVLLIVVIVALVLWVFGLAYAWLGEHRMLAASH